MQDFRHQGHPPHYRYSEALSVLHQIEPCNNTPHGPHSEPLAAALAAIGEEVDQASLPLQQVERQVALAVQQEQQQQQEREQAQSQGRSI